MDTEVRDKNNFIDLKNIFEEFCVRLPRHVHLSFFPLQYSEEMD
jgi:hypothetical protein